jgi:predicted DNA-binding transcriptional regulator AlpA
MVRGKLDGDELMDREIGHRPHDRIVREAEREEITGLSRTTWWRMERYGKAPKRRRLSPNSVGWLLSELTDWMQSRQRAA